jgi:predicted signal transduction protein with EAL and GGDEF domain
VMIGERLRERVRAADTIARLGGDEFAILLPSLVVATDAAAVADDVVAALDAPFELDGVAVDVRASIGMASAPDDGDDADALLRHADVAMYAAKHAHTSVEAYRASVDHYRPERLSLAADLRRAIDADELVLHYQPKIDITTGDVTGCEALVRWQHPEKGLLFPAAFMPVIETTELIRPLTLHVLNQAMAFAHDLRADGLPQHIAVNVSARNTLDTRFPGELAAIVRRHDLPFETLEIELTESAVLDNPKRAQEVLEAIAALGVAISVDDFGTGYASISYLTQLPISTLKIDRSFVHDVTTNPKSAAVVSFSVALARSLGLTTVAEGIEELETLDELRRLGCQQAQGYLLCRPVPAAELRAFIAARAPATPMKA